jgi:hypothetical protein
MGKALEIGELRSQLALDLQKSLEDIRNRYCKKRNYFVLVFADVNTANEVRTKILMMDEKPPKMIGTMVYHITASDVRRLWCLPLDTPKFEGMLSLEEGVKEVFESDRHLPIVYH